MNTRIQMLFFQHLAMSPKELTATALNTFEYICVPQILRVRIGIDYKMREAIYYTELSRPFATEYLREIGKYVNC